MEVRWEELDQAGDGKIALEVHIVEQVRQVCRLEVALQVRQVQQVVHVEQQAAPALESSSKHSWG